MTGRPESVIGLHFFSPANVMRLVEVVRADHTSKTVINTAMQVSRRIRKLAALVGVCPGFVGNRMLAQRSREAGALLDEGAMPWDIDRALYDFGFAMGPLQPQTSPGSTSAGSRSARRARRSVTGCASSAVAGRRPGRATTTTTRTEMVHPHR